MGGRAWHRVVGEEGAKGQEGPGRHRRGEGRAGSNNDGSGQGGGVGRGWRAVSDFGDSAKTRRGVGE